MAPNFLFLLFRWSFARNIPIAHHESSSCQRCFIQTFTLMEEFVSTFSETSNYVTHNFHDKESRTLMFVPFRWSPTYDVSAILTSIQSLLSDPNPNSPANSMAAQLFKENRREYEKRVKACVEQSWCDD